MHHEVAARELLEPCCVQAQPVGPDVAGHGRDPGCDLLVEAVAELRAQAVEAVVPEDLLGGPLDRRRPASGPDQEHHLTVRDAAQDTLDQGGAEEPGRTGDEEAPVRPGRRGRGSPDLSTIW